MNGRYNFRRYTCPGRRSFTLSASEFKLLRTIDTQVVTDSKRPSTVTNERLGNTERPTQYRVTFEDDANNNCRQDLRRKRLQKHYDSGIKQIFQTPGSSVLGSIPTNLVYPSKKSTLLMPFLLSSSPALSTRLAKVFITFLPPTTFISSLVTLPNSVICGSAMEGEDEGKGRTVWAVGGEYGEYSGEESWVKMAAKNCYNRVREYHLVTENDDACGSLSKDVLALIPAASHTQGWPIRIRPFGNASKRHQKQCLAHYSTATPGPDDEGIWV
ncbi:hypothetical protein EDD85DRAFT_974647 [Armillaria nabsnona]|nr:hypothetical protein EDD85DRAFT_974647 [Armillaria nabsnona]